MSEDFFAKRIIEGILFLSTEPLTIRDLASFTGFKPSLVSHCLKELVDDYESRGIQISGAGGAYRMTTNPDIGPYVEKFRAYRDGVSLSRAALETLSVVAYCQPVTRREIEEQRGVNVEAILKKLLDLKLVKIQGRSTQPGRPVLFCTTRKFLETFNLPGIEQLPMIDEIRAIRNARAPGEEGVCEKDPEA